MNQFYTLMRALVIAACVLAIPFSVTRADGPNLIANPSLETTASPDPQGWARGRWGTNQAAFTYPVAGQSGLRAAEVALTERTSGDAKWYFADVPVTAGAQYRFSDYSKGTVVTWVTARYRSANGTYSYVDLGSVPASPGWQRFEAVFTVPGGVTSMTVFHLINQVGTLTVDNYSLATTASSAEFPQGMVTLAFDDGYRTTHANARPILEAAGLAGTFYIVTRRFTFPAYITAAEALATEDAGHEVGSHSRTHANLTTLTQSQMSDEIIGSKADLEAIGIRDVSTFAYPFGAYNSTTDQLVRAAGYTGARTSDGGSTTENASVQKSENPYLLQRYGVVSVTTFAQVRQRIDAAVASRSWQILVFHHVDHSGSSYGTTPEMLQSIVDYLAANAIPVVTMREGAALMRQ